MKILVNGRPKRAKVTTSLITEATSFYMKLLLGDDHDALTEHTSITVNLVKGLLNRYNSVGFCQWLDDPLRPEEFLIELDADMEYRNTLISLAHESTHVMQMIMGWRQESLCGTKMRWMGMMIDIDRYDYYDLPWEIDAHGREYGLYHRYINQHDPVHKSESVEVARRDIPLYSLVPQ